MFIRSKNPKNIEVLSRAQGYNENAWEVPQLKAWLAAPVADRFTATPDVSLVEAVRRFYLESYLRHTHFHPAATFLRNTPQVQYFWFRSHIN